MSTEPKRVALPDAVLLVMGSVIGVGIFISPVGIAQQVQSPAAFLGVWVVAGILTLLACLTVAEIGSTFPREGGMYIFLLELIGKRSAFMLGWCLLTIGSSGGISVIARTLGSYLEELLHLEGTAMAWSAGAILLFGALSALGLGLGARLQSGIMGLKLLAFLALILGGWWTAGAPTPDTPLLQSHATPSPGYGAFALAILPALFAFDGWMSISNITGRLRNPTRDLPRSILIGMVAVIILYLAVSTVYLRSVGIDGIANNELFAAAVAAHIFGTTAGELFTWLVVLSASGVLLTSVILSPWVVVAMARNGHFFRSFAFVHPKTSAPLISLAALITFSLLWLFIADTGLVMNAKMLSIQFLNLLMAIGFLRALSRKPALQRPFISPADPWIPRLYVLLLSTILIAQLLEASSELLLISGGILVSGGLVYGPWRRLVSRSDTRNAS